MDTNESSLPESPELELPTFPIVGIGASAGGLEALEQFFRSVPAPTPMAFVVIQHLSPDFKSVMDDLLGRVTKIPIRQISDGMRVEPGTIYLLPPKQEVILSNGKLLLTERSSQDRLSFPIDYFFRSLAQDAGRRAIAVVLSGTGTDGSRGICDVHEAGGLVMAQSIETAKFDGMPRTACNTGIVDLVLAPESMPTAMLNHVQRAGTGILKSSADVQEVLDGSMYSIFHLL
ncbi:MAG: chemotaxis protein CheB, partial [Pirellulaceae bacterium]